MPEVLFVTLTTCVQLVNGVSGKMANGHPLLVCFGEPPGMYKLAPDPDFSAPETVSTCAMATTGHTQNPQPAHVSNDVTAATGPVIEPVAQSFLASGMGRSAAVTAAAADQLSRVKAQHAVSGSAALSAASPAGTASSPPATAAASIHGIAPSARAFPPSTVFGVFGSGQKVAAFDVPHIMSTRLPPGQGAARPDALRQERPVTAPDAGLSAFQAPKSASVGFQDPAAPLPPVLVAALGQISAGKVAANQAELGGSPHAAVSHQQVGTPLGTTRNNRQQSSGKRGRHRFCIDSESDEEPAQPKKVHLDSRRKEIVAPFSLRSSRKGPDNAEQGAFFQKNFNRNGLLLELIWALHVATQRRYAQWTHTWPCQAWYTCAYLAGPHSSLVTSVAG